MYKGFVDRISTLFNLKLAEMSTIYNFDLGHEFEIALCKVFRTILPLKYGVCRGFIVCENDEFAGDDIIIYNRERFPALRLLNDESFSHKEMIPVESVCAYIEAKHSLVIDGAGPQSVQKAELQLSKVKELIREPVDSSISIDPYVKLPIEASPDPNRPPILNKIFGGIIANKIRISSNDAPIENPEEIMKSFGSVRFQAHERPDFIVAGGDVVFMPFVPDGENGEWQFHSPYMIDGRSKLHGRVVPNRAFSVAISSLLFSLDKIRLGRMPWTKIIAHSLGVEHID
jgi:hypothetical protein